MMDVGFSSSAREDGRPLGHRLQPDGEQGCGALAGTRVGGAHPQISPVLVSPSSPATASVSGPQGPPALRPPGGHFLPFFLFAVKGCKSSWMLASHARRSLQGHMQGGRRSPSREPGHFMTVFKGCFRSALAELMVRRFYVRGRVGLSPVWAAPSQVAPGAQQVRPQVTPIALLWAVGRRGGHKNAPVISPIVGSTASDVPAGAKCCETPPHPPSLGPELCGVRAPHPHPTAAPLRPFAHLLSSWREDKQAVLTSLLTMSVTSSSCFSLSVPEPSSKKPKLVSSGWGEVRTQKA